MVTMIDLTAAVEFIHVLRPEYRCICIQLCSSIHFSFLGYQISVCFVLIKLSNFFAVSCNEKARVSQWRN